MNKEVKEKLVTILQLAFIGWFLAGTLKKAQAQPSCPDKKSRRKKKK